MRRAKLFLQTHVIGIFFAVVVGIISVLPSFLAPLALGSNYKGIQFLYVDDEDIYRARIHEILDGHPAVASPYLFEYKDMRVPMPPLGEFFYALPAFFFGLGVVILLSKFLFPAVLFFLIYFLTKKLIVEEGDVYAKITPITSGLLVMFGYDLIDYHYVAALLQGQIASTHLLLWTRLVNPITGGLLLFSFLITLWMIIKKTFRFTHILGGILLALMVGYFFSFGLALAILAALFCIFLLNKEYAIARKFAAVFFIALLVDIPYWYNVFTAIGGTDGKLVASRNGMFFTHAPIINKVLLLATIFFAASFIYAYFIKKERSHQRSWQFMTAILLGAWGAFNQQIVTGREIWPFHFVQYTIPLSFVVIITTAFIVWRKHFPRLWMLGMITALSGSLLIGVFSAYSYVYKIPEFQNLQRYSTLFSWLDTKAPKECVVLLKERNDELERLIPAYTHCNVYSTESVFFGVTSARVLHNYLLRMRLNGVDQVHAHEYLLAHQETVRSYFYDDWNQLFGQGEDTWLLGRVSFLEKEYQMFLKGDLKKQIQMYRLDYLLTEKVLTAQELKQLPGLHLKQTLDEFFLYSFK